MGHFGNDPGDNIHLEQVQLVGNAIIGQGTDGRIAENRLPWRLGRRIAHKGRIHVCGQKMTDVRELADKFPGDIPGTLFTIFAQRFIFPLAHETIPTVDLLSQLPVQTIQIGSNIKGHTFRSHIRRSIIPGEKHRPQIFHNSGQHIHRRHGGFVPQPVAGQAILVLFTKLFNNSRDFISSYHTISLPGKTGVAMSYSSPNKAVLR